MRTDPISGVSYLLRAGSYISLFIRKAVFSSLTSLRFDVTFLGEQVFFEDLLNGYLPYQNWSLSILDDALNELGHYSWQHSQVIRVRVPELVNSSLSVIALSVELFLTGLTEGSQSQASASNAQTASRRDPAPLFAFRFVADGLEEAEWSVSKVGALDLGMKSHDDLVFTVTPEANADPFRDWLRNGNLPKSASLHFLGSDLRQIFRMNLTGLRVITVVPPLTTFSPSDATIRLNYGSMSFEFIGSGSVAQPVPPKFKPLMGLGGLRRGS